MASPRIEYAVLPAGDGPGQDRCFTAEGLVVVLDGASAYDPSVSPDAGEYVDTLGPALVEQITGTPGIDLRDALAEAIRQAADKLQLIPGKGPSSTVSIVRWGDETVDALVLGDSPIIVQFANGHQETLVQHPMDHIAPNLRRRYRERLAAGRGYDDEHRALLAEIQRQEVPLRNRTGGYFIAEADPIAASHAQWASWSVDGLRALTLATDGIENAAQGSGLQLARSAREDREGLLEFLHHLQEWESRADPDGELQPRSKRHDDKTIAVLTPSLNGPRPRREAQR